MDRFAQDLRFAFRTLRKNWPVTLLVVGSLSLAIAGNTIVYSLINGLLYKPLPYEEPNRLVLVSERAEGTPSGFVNPASPANFLDWRERQTSFVDLAGFETRPMGLDQGGDQLTPLTAARVSPSFFPLLGVQPTIGRSFGDHEATRGQHRVAILQHKYWIEQHGGSDEALGKILKMNGEPYEVVGVTPEGFEFLAPDIDIWVPLPLERHVLDRSERNMIAVGRLKDGVAEDEAQAELERIHAQLVEEYPDDNAGFVVEALNLREEIPDPNNRLFFKLLQGAMFFVVLIACANIANLLMARSQKREREMAVRTSIGAGRGQIVRQLLTESVVMALFAGVLGAALGALGVDKMRDAMSAVLPPIYEPVVDARVLLYTLGVTIAGGLLFGLAPVLQTAKLDLVSSLKDGTAAASSGRGKRWATKLLVVAELALALVFLGGSGILLQAFDALQNQNSGFDTSNLLTLQVQLPPERYGSDEAKVAAWDSIGTELGGLGGVDAVMASNILPRFFFIPQDDFLVESNPPPADQPTPQISFLTTTPGFFDQLGIHLTEGRAVTAADRLDTTPVAVLNRAAVDRFFAGESPLGQRVTIQGATHEVIGVVEDVRHQLAVAQGVGATAYLAWAQHPQRTIFLSVGTKVPPEKLTQPVRMAMHRVDPAMAVSDIQSLDGLIDSFWAGQRVVSAIVSGFGSLALFLAALGTYGVLAYSVALRTQEIGVRMALGASRRQVVVMVMRQGLILGLIGLLLGLPGVYVVKLALDAIMAGFVPVEMTASGSALAVMVVVVVLACFIPARRAASLDPLRALRWE